MSAVNHGGKAVFAKKTNREPLKSRSPSRSIGVLLNPTTELMTSFGEWPTNATLQAEH